MLPSNEAISAGASSQGNASSNFEANGYHKAAESRTLSSSIEQDATRRRAKFEVFFLRPLWTIPDNIGELLCAWTQRHTEFFPVTFAHDRWRNWPHLARNRLENEHRFCPGAHPHIFVIIDSNDLEREGAILIYKQVLHSGPESYQWLRLKVCEVGFLAEALSLYNYTWHQITRCLVYEPHLRDFPTFAGPARFAVYMSHPQNESIGARQLQYVLKVAEGAFRALGEGCCDDFANLCHPVFEASASDNEHDVREFHCGVASACKVCPRFFIALKEDWEELGITLFNVNEMSIETTRYQTEPQMLGKILCGLRIGEVDWSCLASRRECSRSTTALPSSRAIEAVPLEESSPTKSSVDRAETAPRRSTNTNATRPSVLLRGHRETPSGIELAVLRK